MKIFDLFNLTLNKIKTVNVVIWQHLVKVNRPRERRGGGSMVGRRVSGNKQVALEAHENEGVAEMSPSALELNVPLGLDQSERVRVVQGEAQDDDLVRIDVDKLG